MRRFEDLKNGITNVLHDKVFPNMGREEPYRSSAICQLHHSINDVIHYQEDLEQKSIEVELFKKELQSMAGANECPVKAYAIMTGRA